MVKDGPAVYVRERPETTITDDGVVHLTYVSGGAFYERVFPLDQYEEHLFAELRKVRDWKRARRSRASA